MIRPVVPVEQFDLQVGFNTPAFLGNATQEAQWRTPPFKALLRRWWRVARAADVGYDHRRLLAEEQRLFGAAGEEGTPAGRSQVQLRLSTWEAGAGTQLPRTEQVWHPEVNRGPAARPPGTGESGRPVDAQVYLGYGPVSTQGSRSFIAPETTVRLRIRVPQAHATQIARSVQLAAWFGGLGSRNRNGWGSLRIEGPGVKGYSALSEAALNECGVLRPLAQCIGGEPACEWPHAIGLCDDARPAVWRIIASHSDLPAQAGGGGTPTRARREYQGFEHWREVMVRLARARIGLRTQFKFESGQRHRQVEARHVLAYPVTNHDLDIPNAERVRLANQLCFKVIEQSGRYFGVVYHLPFSMPQAFFGNGGGSGALRPPPAESQISVWGQVHRYLQGVGIRGADLKLQRIRA